MYDEWTGYGLIWMEARRKALSNSLFTKYLRDLLKCDTEDIRKLGTKTRKLFTNKAAALNFILESGAEFDFFIIKRLKQKTKEI